MQQQLLDAGEDGAAPSRSLSLRMRVAATGLAGSAHVMGELQGTQAREERRHQPSSDRQFGLAEVVLAAMLQQLPFVVSSGGKVEWSWPPGHINRGTLPGKQTEKSVQAFAAGCHASLG